MLDRGKLAVQGVKLTFLFLAIFTPIKTPLFQHRAEAGDEVAVHNVFEGVVFWLRTTPAREHQTPIMYIMLHIKDRM